MCQKLHKVLAWSPVFTYIWHCMFFSCELNFNKLYDLLRVIFNMLHQSGITPHTFGMIPLCGAEWGSG